jgi:crotonobetainyl-CoA:carnitine CoA-transferase CaiB-like acyl-CoA transferase
VASRKSPSLPLDGILVADFSRVLAGPLCTQLLADAGARVIKVEEPTLGDDTRQWGPPFIGEASAYFLSINRNKESLAVDLKTPAGADVARRLIGRADVVVDNFLPAQRATLLPCDPCEANERIVHCSITGFDGDTSEAAIPGYDLLAQAGAGLMSITGEPDGEPMKVGVAVTDVLTALYAFGAIASALRGRERSGRGARIEVSLFSAALASLVNVAQNALGTGREAQRYGNAHPSIVPYQVFHASDRAFALGVGNDRHFALLCERVLAQPELARDRRFATNGARVRNRSMLVPMLDAIFRARRASYWVTRCRGCGIPVSPVRGVREALRSAGAQTLIEAISHSATGDYETVRNPIRFDGQRLPIRSAPPALGEHSESILRELGFDASVTAAAKKRKAPRKPRR